MSIKLISISQHSTIFTVQLKSSLKENKTATSPGKAHQLVYRNAYKLFNINWSNNPVNVEKVVI